MEAFGKGVSRNVFEDCCADDDDSPSPPEQQSRSVSMIGQPLDLSKVTGDGDLARFLEDMDFGSNDVSIVKEMNNEKEEDPQEQKPIHQHQELPQPQPQLHHHQQQQKQQQQNGQQPQYPFPEHMMQQQHLYQAYSQQQQQQQQQTYPQQQQQFLQHQQQQQQLSLQHQLQAQQALPFHYHAQPPSGHYYQTQHQHHAMQPQREHFVYAPQPHYTGSQSLTPTIQPAPPCTVFSSNNSVSSANSNDRQVATGGGSVVKKTGQQILELDRQNDSHNNILFQAQPFVDRFLPANAVYRAILKRYAEEVIASKRLPDGTWPDTKDKVRTKLVTDPDQRTVLSRLEEDGRTSGPPPKDYVLWKLDTGHTVKEDQWLEQDFRVVPWKGNAGRKQALDSKYVRAQLGSCMEAARTKLLKGEIPASSQPRVGEPFPTEATSRNSSGSQSTLGKRPQEEQQLHWAACGAMNPLDEQKKTGSGFTPPSSNLTDAGRGYTTSDLYGREELLLRLGRELAPQDSAARLRQDGCPVVSLLGSSGLGKTHVAIRWAYDWIHGGSIGGRENDNHNKHRCAFWLNASSESSLSNSYQQIIRRIEGQRGDEEGSCCFHDGKRQRQSVQALANALCSLLSDMPDYVEWILIFDNVPNVIGDTVGPAAFEEWFFGPETNWRHRLAQQGRILFVATHDYFKGHTKTNLGTIHGIETNVLDQAAAVNMVTVGLQQDSSNRDAIKELVRLLGYHPSLIDAAVAEINNTCIAVETYVAELGGAVCTSPPEAITRTVKNAIKHARGDQDAVLRALRVAAYVHPDGLQLSLLGVERKAVTILVHWKILRYMGDVSAGEAEYCIHRLHQQAARQVLEQQVEADEGKDDATERRAECLELAINNIADLIRPFDRDQPKHQRTWHLPLAMVPHVEALVRLEHPWDAKLSLKVAEVLRKTGEIMRWISRFKASHFMLEEALRLYCGQVNNKNKATDGVVPEEDAVKVQECIARTHLWLGRVDKACSRYESAIQHYESALVTVQKLGARRQDDSLRELTVDIVDDIGRIHHNNKEFDEALKKLEQSLDIRLSLVDDQVKEAVTAGFRLPAEQLPTALRQYGVQFRSRSQPNIRDFCGGKEEAATKMMVSFRGLANTFVCIGRVYRDGRKEIKGGRKRLTASESKNDNLDEALAWFDAALGGQVIAKMGQDKRNDSISTTLSHIGRTLLQQIASGGCSSPLMKATEASTILKDSLSMKQEVYGATAVNESIATAVNFVAEADNRLGEIRHGSSQTILAKTHFEDALGNYRMVLTMMRKIFEDPSHKKVLQACLGIGSVLKNLTCHCNLEASRFQEDVENLLAVAKCLVGAADHKVQRARHDADAGRALKLLREAEDKYKEAKRMLHAILEVDGTVALCREQIKDIDEKLLEQQQEIG